MYSRYKALYSAQKKSAVRRNIPPRQRLPHACCEFSATPGATASQGKSGAISHRVKKTPPSGGTSHRDSGYLTYVARSAQRHAQQPDELISGAISHSRACFARESRQARTGVRNWRIERRKARYGKAKSLRAQKKFPASCYSPIVKYTVPSPLEPLTTVFGKGTCVSAPL